MNDLRQLNTCLYTTDNMTESILGTLMNMLRQMNTLSIHEVMKLAINEAAKITHSQIGFFHFVDMKSQTIDLMVWSTNTLRYCNVPDNTRRYPISSAGVWVECLKTASPVVYNDYANAKHKRGLPEGHVHVTRFISVPIYHEKEIVAIIGVGNKKSDYNDIDVQTLSTFAEMAWQIIQRKRAEQALITSNQLLESNIEDRTRKLIQKNNRLKEEISRRRSVERILRERHQHIQEAQSLGNMGYWEYDIETEAIFWSLTMYELFERDVKDLSPTFEEFISYFEEAEWHKLSNALKMCVETQTSQHYRLSITLSDGEQHQLIGILRPILNRHNNVELVFGVIQDFTRHYEFEDIRFKQTLEQERMNLLSDFGAIASHEFRTPLSIIGTSSYLLNAKIKGSDHTPYLDRINKQIERLTKLIDTLIQITGLDQVSTINPVPNNVVNMLEDAINSKHFSDRQVICDFSIPPDLQLSCDRKFLVIAIEHLIDNAINYTLDDGTVTIRAQQIENNLIIEVIDDGEGILPEHLPHLFERFFRADTAHTSAGFGLGLPIVQTIANLHNGNIDVSSEVDKGTICQLTLPL